MISSMPSGCESSSLRSACDACTNLPSPSFFQVFFASPPESHSFGPHPTPNKTAEDHCIPPSTHCQCHTALNSCDPVALSPFVRLAIPTCKPHCKQSTPTKETKRHCTNQIWVLICRPSSLMSMQAPPLAMSKTVLTLFVLKHVCSTSPSQAFFVLLNTLHLGWA